jgi:hypothetical protein
MTANRFSEAKFTAVTLQTSIQSGHWIRVNVSGHFEYYKIGEYFDKPKGYEIKRDGFSSAGLILTLSIEDMVKKRYEIMFE